MADIVPIFKNLRAKSREVRLQNRRISVPNVRATLNRRAQNQPVSFMRRSTPPCALVEDFGAAARVFCAKTVPKFIESFAISTENHAFRPQILRPNATAELRRSFVSYATSCISFFVICACVGGRHRADFQKFARKITRSSTAKS